MINPSKPKYSVEDFFHKLQDYETRQLIPHRACVLVKTFFTSYVAALQGTSHNLTDYLWIFLDYLDLIKKQIETPYAFEPYHKRLTTPYDYHLFGIEFFRPLIDEELSSLQGQDSLQELAHHVTEGGNVILFANHQIEADPQVLHLSLEKSHPELMSHLVFVAGERVITDPLAVPFSLGCNLLCIYSKRYIDYPPEKKTLKQHHNQRTMKLMHALLDEGGHCIYVAPSGGRDRPDHNGKLLPAPFDAQSIEMFHLMAKHAKKPTWFYPLALSTYHLLPPPENVQQELGEHRSTQAGPIHVGFGKKIDMESFPGHEIADKSLRRKAKADYIYHLVGEIYKKFV